MSYRTAGVSVMLSTFLYVLCGGAAFAHDILFGSKWDDLRFMDDDASGTTHAPEHASKVRMEVDVFKVRAGRGKRVANRITGHIIKGRERSGVLTDKQYVDLLRSVNDGWNLRAFQSTVVTFADRLGTASWRPEGEDTQALVDMRFARYDDGLWKGSVDFLSINADKALQAQFRTTENRLFLRGKRGGDWLLVVTVRDDDMEDETIWSPNEGYGHDF